MLVFHWCYHGTVDETLVTLDDSVVGATPRQPRASRRTGGDDARRRIQRRGRARGRAGPRRRRLRARRAGHDEHRHRPPEPGFHDALREATRRDRDAAHPRRDPHDLGRARRLHARLGTSGRTCSRSASRSPAAVPAGLYGAGGLSSDLARRIEAGNPRRRGVRYRRHRRHARRAMRFRSPRCARR